MRWRGMRLEEIPIGVKLTQMISTLVGLPDGSGLTGSRCPMAALPVVATSSIFVCVACYLMALVQDTPSLIISVSWQRDESV